MIKVIQIGIGPLGRNIYKFIAQRASVQVVAAVDTNPELVGKDLGMLCSGNADGVLISSSLEEALKSSAPQVAILTTVSSMDRITPQILQIMEHGLHVVSTCEELSYPWLNAPDLANKINKAAIKHSVNVIGTGVNPGFLMDSLPSFMTAVCQHVDSITVSRYQDATSRRIPFQQKIGAGLTLEEFEKKKNEGTLRHVGLTESVQFIASRMDWKLDSTEDVISPVIAPRDIKTEGVDVKKGNAAGVNQVGKGFVKGKAVITLIFQAAIGEPESFEEIVIDGAPKIVSRINGGINGDIATCAITINLLKQVLKGGAGLKTMGDVPLVSYFS